jgi:hypothetical protein
VDKWLALCLVDQWDQADQAVLWKAWAWDQADQVVAWEAWAWDQADQVEALWAVLVMQLAAQWKDQEDQADQVDQVDQVDQEDQADQVDQVDQADQVVTLEAVADTKEIKIFKLPFTSPRYSFINNFSNCNIKN